MRVLFIVSVFMSACLPMYAQVSSVDKLDANNLNWQNRDPEKDKTAGTSVDKAYSTLLADKKPKKTIIVAVIDGGVDIDHEDLKEKIWVNEDEIPGNNIDDDKNGYVDDVHGWNFIGNAQGQNINEENVEYTRLVKDKNSPFYSEAKQLFDAEFEKRTQEKASIEKFQLVYNRAKAIIKGATNADVRSLEDINKIQTKDPDALRAIAFLKDRYENGFTEEILQQIITQNNLWLQKRLNVNFNARAIVGDDPTNLNDRNYGNPDVKGPRANHGTSVAGVIAAVRNNNIGINGIASDVKLMILRSTPDGDERDKDVALAIKYAVDNGAHIINMSFGKQLSPQKAFVDEMVKYADEKNVLLVHAAGNEGSDVDLKERYPSDRYLDGSEPKNWIGVGACGSKLNDEVATVFSNYGKIHVDLFAPGEHIISTDTTNTYSENDGTSLAAPVVSGVAALILSYYPDLTPSELISILMQSSYKIDKKVMIPGRTEGERKKVKFSELSASGGIVNAYEALLLAQNGKPAQGATR
ncbi:MAG: S8 family peptidase [Cyclobacteriaceae bacterium]|nr:S8 family peptidase [Cyclobacteriaceae bacterium]